MHGGDMRKGEKKKNRGAVGPGLCAVLACLLLIACGSDSAKPDTAKNSKAQLPEIPKPVNFSKMTLGEYAALDQESRMDIARFYAERNTDIIEKSAAMEEEKAEKVPEGHAYSFTEYDLSLLPEAADVDSSLMSTAREKPDFSLHTAAGDYIMKKNTYLIKVVLRTK
jgi:hypothetical protein